MALKIADVIWDNGKQEQSKCDELNEAPIFESAGCLLAPQHPVPGCAVIKLSRLWTEEVGAVGSFLPSLAQSLCPLLSTKAPVRPHEAPLQGRMCKQVTADAEVCRFSFSYADI